MLVMSREIKLPLIILALGLASFFLVSAFSEEQIVPVKIQWKLGIPINEIECKKGFELIVKKHDNSPACVLIDTASRLLELGWAKEIIKYQNQNFTDTWNLQSNFMQESASPSSSSGGYMGNIGSSQTGSYTLEESLSLQQSRAESAGANPASGSGINQGISDKNIGFAVGGAQDINNFRSNIENDFLPLHTDITYEGLFYDYYFDTGSKTQECQKLFCPSYSYAISKDPFSNNDEYYLSVGLNSGLKESDFERKKLNLVIVLDVSGSMSSPFNNYYYDSMGNQILREDYTENDVKTKMQLANESVAGLLDHLKDGDNFGVVLFNGHAHLSKPIESIGYTDKEKLKENILNIYSGGSTNMEAGMKLGTSLFDDFTGVDSDEYENRIIFLTDAMPNTGNISKQGLFGIISDNSKNKIYTTFIGIGVDLNTELVEELTKVRGANYYSVHSASEFKNRMVDEFEFMVTPLVFNLLLNLDADGYDIKKVYGSPEADETTGQIMKINTLFPSKTQDGETKGGIVLLKLKKTSENSSLVLKTSYENRMGEKDGEEIPVEINSQESNYYENSGIQKGILLSRYAEFLQTWVFDERLSKKGDIITPWTYYEHGIQIPDYVESKSLGKWERQSIPLQVSDPYEQLIPEFNEYFNQEMISIDDQTLQQEVDILNKLENY